MLKPRRIFRPRPAACFINICRSKPELLTFLADFTGEHAVTVTGSSDHPGLVEDPLLPCFDQLQQIEVWLGETRTLRQKERMNSLLWLDRWLAQLESGLSADEWCRGTPGSQSYLLQDFPQLLAGGPDRAALWQTGAWSLRRGHLNLLYVLYRCQRGHRGPLQPGHRPQKRPGPLQPLDGLN